MKYEMRASFIQFRRREKKTSPNPNWNIDKSSKGL